MKIDHIAVWVDDLEMMREFYTRYFGMTAGDKYVNPAKQYTSYFLSVEDGDMRIELMHRPDITVDADKRGLVKGFCHLAFSVGSKESVDELTERLRTDGYTVLGEPRTSGDGYYESVISDPEGNYVEIVG